MIECLRRTTTPLLLGIMLIALFAPWPAEATRISSYGPTVVATIDLQKVMDSLAERADLEAALTAQSQNILAERDRRQAEIEQLNSELGDMVEGPEQVKMQDALDLKLLQEMAWLRFIQQEIDVEKALMLQNLYMSMEKHVAELAEIEGIDLVIIDDTTMNFQLIPGVQVSRQDQIREQIANKRVLYRSLSIDISDDLIVRMNNEYAASSGAR